MEQQYPKELTNLPKTDDVPIEDLEQIRPRLTQLVYSLNKLQDNLIQQSFQNSNKNTQISIQNQLNVIIQQLSSISKNLQLRKNNLSSITVFPNSQFNLMSGLQNSLLRTKFTPNVESWINSAKSDSVNNIIDNTSNILDESFFNLEDELTNSVSDYARDKLDDYIFGGYLTKNDIDNGLSVKDVLNEIEVENGNKNENNTENKTENNIDSDDEDKELAIIDNGKLERFLYQGVIS